MQTLVLITVTLYLLGLYALARWGERQAARGALSGRKRAWIHGLALGVYCSTWTVFGAIGSAVREGYAYLPIYLGPIALALFAPTIWERLVRLKQRHRLASVADFLSARFGRNAALPALVALISLAAVVPYVALQLAAVDGSLAALGFAKPAIWTCVFAGLVVSFTLRFGVLDARTLVERPGLILVLGIESAVKLAIVIALALWAASNSETSALDWHRALHAQTPNQPIMLAGQVLLAAAASLLLPRMFQVGVVECADVGELRLARRVFAGYLLLVSVAVMPIAALAGYVGGSGADFVLISLPIALQQPNWALLAFIAGLSAASAMMIAAWLALSIMLSNDLVVPLMVRSKMTVSAQRVLAVRRTSVAAAAVMSLFWYLGVDGGTLAQTGLLAFAGVAQFAPPLLAALFFPRSSAKAVLAGLGAGAGVWALLMLWPSLTGAALSSASLTERALLALALNSATCMLLSTWRPASVRARLHAADFLATATLPRTFIPTAVRVDDIYALCESLLGKNYRHALALHHDGLLLPGEGQASAQLLAAAERSVAEVFGSASARELIADGIRGAALDVDAVLRALDQSMSRYRVNVQLLEATFEHMHQAVSVIDAQLQLAGWNRQYEALFAWPAGMLEHGRPIADLIAYAAHVSGLDAAQVEIRVARRLHQLRTATGYRNLRTLADGRSLDIRGEPLPEGGFVTTFFDVSESVRAAAALQAINTQLEQRVAERTRELLRLAELKNQFIAAASHDLLQPLSAARLYLAAEHNRLSGSVLLQRADSALAVTEELLGGLTDLARLETGQLKPERSAFALQPLLDSLHAQAQELAEQRGLFLRVRPSAEWVDSDPRLLRRIVQNFVANSLRYTARGGVLIAVRRQGSNVAIMVYDTGPGMDENLRATLFNPHDASAAISPWGERGLGLGLAGCKLLADALGHHVAVASRVNRGSCFSVSVPRALPRLLTANTVSERGARLQNVHALCVDDHADVRMAMRSLLESWGVNVHSAANSAQALAQLAAHAIDLALVDFSLGEAQSGLDLITLMQQLKPGLHCVLVSAERDPELPARAAAVGITLLKKPIRPAALRALLESLR